MKEEALLSIVECAGCGAAIWEKDGIAYCPDCDYVSYDDDE